MTRKKVVTDPQVLAEPQPVTEGVPPVLTDVVSEGGKKAEPEPPPAPTGEESAPGPVESTPEVTDPSITARRTFLDQALGGFDPSVHVVDEHGEPVLNADGTLRKKRGRKPGQKTTSQETPAQTAAPENQVPPIGTREMAGMLTRMFTVTMTKIVGDEWSPASREELAGLESATERYLTSIGGIQLSPLHYMLLAYGSYSVARIGHENTRSKVGRIVWWVKSKVAGVFGVFRR